MPHEIITLQVGQCGNQVAWKFWAEAIQEHAKFCGNQFDDAFSTFFRNVDTSSASTLNGLEPSVPAHVDGLGQRSSRLSALRANAVLIDTEEGVVKQIKASGLGELFTDRCIVTDVSGAGNNWAHGFAVYGPAHESRLHDVIQTALEPCDSPQGFMFVHSLGGGTGSGLGSFLMQACADWFPSMLRLSLPVIPSPNDDVVTSPYNAVLALNTIYEHADVALPMDNSALLSVVQRWDTSLQRRGAAMPAVSMASGRTFIPKAFHEAPRRQTGAQHIARSAAARIKQSVAADRLSRGKPATAKPQRSTASRSAQQSPLGSQTVSVNKTEDSRPLKPAAAASSKVRELEARYRQSGGGPFPTRQRGPRPQQPQAVQQNTVRETSAFDSMNSLGASLLCNITAPMRFHGQLNVDFNEVCTNLVPFPAMNLVSSSMAPFPRSAPHGGVPPSLNELFVTACAPSSSLVSASRSTAASAYSVAVGFLGRGQDIAVGDFEQCIRRSIGLRSAAGYGAPDFWAPRSSTAPVRLVEWNLDGVKAGLTGAPNSYADKSVTVLNNTTAITEPLERLKNDFQRLYCMRAHLHHYTDILSEDAIVGTGAFGTALDTLMNTIDGYKGAENLLDK